jgi:hypothetical protein
MTSDGRRHRCRLLVAPSVNVAGLTVTWMEQCQLSSESDDCMTDRSRLETEDPFTLLVWEHTFTRSGDDPDY